MDWYLTLKVDQQSPQSKQAYQHLMAVCCELKWSQSMVKLHSLMSTYNVETMLCSRFIFNYGNTHNGLVSDQKGCSKPPKQACLHWLTACHDAKLTQSMVELHSLKSIYNVETMLCSRFIFNNGNTQWTDIWPKRVIRAPKTSMLTPIGGLSWPEIVPEHGQTTFLHVYI